MGQGEGGVGFDSVNDKQDVSLPQASAVLRSAEINWPWGFWVAVMVGFFFSFPSVFFLT